MIGIILNFEFLLFVAALGCLDLKCLFLGGYFANLSEAFAVF